jgi:outer membrane protein TolC
MEGSMVTSSRPFHAFFSGALTAMLEAKAALAKAEAEMFQAELDYRTIYAQMKLVMGEQ